MTSWLLFFLIVAPVYIPVMVFLIPVAIYHKVFGGVDPT